MRESGLQLGISFRETRCELDTFRFDRPCRGPGLTGDGLRVELHHHAGDFFDVRNAVQTHRDLRGSVVRAHHGVCADQYITAPVGTLAVIHFGDI
jgi:hypothetical protein